MKFLAAAALAGVASAGLVEKRGLSCNTHYGAEKLGRKVPTNTHVKNAGHVVTRTVSTAHTVTIDPTVSTTLTGTVVSTDSITATKTSSTTTTVTVSSTSTVAAQPGFTAAQHALLSRAPGAKDNIHHAGAAKHHSGSHTGSVAHHTGSAAHHTHTGAHTGSAGAHEHHEHSVTKHHSGAHHAESTHAAAVTKKTKRDAAPEAAQGGKHPVSVDCVHDLQGKVQTVYETVAQRPYKTRYNAAHTVTFDHRKTMTVSKVVATSVVHKLYTAEVPRATHWAACQDDNLLGWTFGGQSGNGGISFNSSTGGNSSAPAMVGISSVILVSGTVPQRFDTSTAAQCCISCQTTPGCLGSAWRAGVCTVQIRPGQSDTCSASEAVFTIGTFFANPLAFLGIGDGLILSNGRCGGIWAFGGLTL